MPAECNDCTQVRGLARRLADQDENDNLQALFGQPTDLPDHELLPVTQEEGWILGMP